MPRTLIALAVARDTTAEARQAIEAYAQQADLVELRIDGMVECDLAELIRTRPCPVIITNRPHWEGGRYEGEEQPRIDRLLEAAALGAEHIDCELEAAARLAGHDLGNTRLILSKHDFAAMPPLAPLHRRCREAGADIAKVVGTAATIPEALEALRVLRDEPGPTIALAMGGKGILSRILAIKYGAYLTFASPGARGTAPGQLSIDDLLSGYQAARIDHDTDIYGVLSEGPIDHPNIARANETLRSEGRNAVIIPLDISGENPAQTAAACRQFGFTAILGKETGPAGALAMALAHLR